MNRHITCPTCGSSNITQRNWAKKLFGAIGTAAGATGGFAGTIQAFVPDHLAEKYVSTLEHVFGKGSCHKLFIRPQGAIRVKIC